LILCGNRSVPWFQVYIEMINDYEIKTGQKSALSRKVTAEEAAQNEDVQKIIKPHILPSICFSLVLTLSSKTMLVLP